MGQFYKWSKWMMLVILVTALVMGVGRAGGGLPQEQSRHSEDDAWLARGEQLYGKYCALCHGDHGEGYSADNANALGNQDFLVSVSDNFLWWSIANGRPGTAMAAHTKRYGGPLDDADIDSLVALIRSWQREESADISTKPILGDPVSGRIAYDQICAACHGDQGKGITAISLSNPEFLTLASDEQIRFAISNGRRDTPMVAYHDQISEDTIDDLVALIRSWKRDVPDRIEEPEFVEFPEVVLNPDGPSPQFSLREGRYVPAEQLDAAMRKGSRLIILDARPPSDWYLAHIPGAVSAPAYDPDSIIVLLPEDDTWIIVPARINTRIN